MGRSEWRASLSERNADLWSDIRWHIEVAELGGVVVGLATGTYLGNVNIGVIGYLSVASSARGLGVGPALRLRLLADFKKDARQLSAKDLRAVVGEVRRDNPWLKTLIRRDRVLALDFAYQQPRLRPEDEPVPLVLYYESLGRVRRRLPAADIRKLLYTIWRRIYRIPRPLATKVFRRMLRDLDGRTSVGQIRLADLDRPKDATR